MVRNRSIAARGAAAIAALFHWSSAPADAAPDFSTSTIEASSEAPLEGDVITYTVTVRNGGDQDAGGAQIDVEWPVMGYYLGARGLDDPQVDHEARKVASSVSLPAGGERRFEVDVLAPRDGGGSTLTLALHVANYFTSTEHWDRKSVAIDTRPATGGVRLGPVRVTEAGIAVLAWLAVGAASWLGAGALVRRRPGARTAVVAMWIALGFWLVFAGLAWRDYRALTAWTEAECTIAGRRVKAESSTSMSDTRTRTRATTTYAPELALRYRVDGRDLYSTGFDTGSSLRVGGRARREAQAREWTVGATVPCWYDPAEPRDVVVERGFGGAYLFALFPLPVFLFGLARLRKTDLG